jgi:hypothetical protein
LAHIGFCHPTFCRLLVEGGIGGRIGGADREWQCQREAGYKLFHKVSIKRCLNLNAGNGEPDFAMWKIDCAVVAREESVQRIAL